MDHVEGFSSLDTRMQDLFKEIYERHMAALGQSARESHVLKRVKVNRKEQCFEAHYEHEWYKYYPNGTWG